MGKKLDTGRGSGISNDEYLWRLKIKVPPIRKQKQVSKEEFEKLLKVQRAVKTPAMSKDEFIKCLKEPEKYGRRRKYRTIKERRESARKWFSIQEDNWWTNEEMKILIFLDQKKFKSKVVAYKRWTKEYVKQCKRVYSQLKKKDPKLAEEFIEEAWERLESAKPRKRSDMEQMIITRIRRLTLQRRYFELNKLMEEVRPLVKAAIEVA